MPVYAIVAGKGGPKLQKADVEEKDSAEGPFIVMPGRTGLDGLYRIQTAPWQPMDLRSSLPAPGAKQDGSDLTDLPTIFEIFEKLGLKLESQKGQVEIYVIDHVEKPSQN